MSVVRYDALKLGKMEDTPEGYLRGDAMVTRCGIFRYLRADGKVKRELRHPLDVLDSRSLDTLRLLPVTVDHPRAMVTAADVKALSVGATGENYRVVDGKVLLSLCIQDAKAVATVKAGKNQLSLGYEAEIEDGPGKFDGADYDTRQRSIRYNHLAIVDSARAGPEARIRLDSGSAIQTLDEEDTAMPPNDAAPNLVSVRVDGLEYKASPEIARALEKANQTIADSASKLEKAAADLAAANKATETEKGRADGLKAKLDEAEKGLPQRVKDRTAFLARAKLVLGDDLKDDQGEVEIMKAALLKLDPEIKLDGKSDEYVRARFDAAVEDAEEGGAEDGETPIARQRKVAKGDGTGAPRKGGADTRLDADSARTRMLARLRGEKVEGDAPTTGTKE